MAAIRNQHWNLRNPALHSQQVIRRRLIEERATGVADIIRGYRRILW